jgi:hypothetical protein
LKFILINEDVKQNCLKHLLSLYADGKNEVVFQESITKRTLNQNALAHKWLGLICDYTGDHIDDLKDNIKDAMGEYKIIEKNGKDYIKYNSSAKFSVKTMMNFMTAIEIMAGELGIVLPSAQYYGLTI